MCKKIEFLKSFDLQTFNRISYVKSMSFFFNFHFKAIQWPYLTIETHIKFLVNVALILTPKIQGVSLQFDHDLCISPVNTKLVDFNTMQYANVLSSDRF